MDFSKIEEGRETENIPEDQMVFHYNREERLKHAPEIVRQYYSGEFKPYKGGLLKSLVNTRGNRLLFVTIVFTFGIIMFMNFFGPQKNTASCHGVTGILSAASYGDEIQVSVKFEEAEKKYKKDFEGGQPLKVAFTAYDNQGSPVFQEKALAKYDGNEVFVRTKCTDYDIIKMSAVFSILDESRYLECSIEKR